jgi:hypothetical protein
VTLRSNCDKVLERVQASSNSLLKRMEGSSWL